jgi:hypothetical protein
MWKKLLILSLSVAMLFIITGCSSDSNVIAQANDEEVNWQIVGTIVQLIDVESLFFGPLEDRHSLMHLSAEGPPDSAAITLLSISKECPAELPFPCEEGYIPGACFTKNDMVAIFPDPDQSLLFASIHEDGGVLCLKLNPDTFLPEDGTYFKIRMNITRGTGKFVGASGVLTGEGHAYFIQNPPANDLTLLGENGRIIGTIVLPD